MATAFVVCWCIGYWIELNPRRGLRRRHIAGHGEAAGVSTFRLNPARGGGNEYGKKWQSSNKRLIYYAIKADTPPPTYAIVSGNILWRPVVAAHILHGLSPLAAKIVISGSQPAGGSGGPTDSRSSRMNDLRMD